MSRDASDEDIRKAYRRLAKKNHPDRNPGDAAAEARFKEVSKAYEALKDGKQANQANQADQGVWSTWSSSFDVSDVFGDLFGARRRQRPRHGSHIAMAVRVTLEEVFRGVKKTISFRKSVQCGRCHGTGVAAGEKPRKCNSCGGKGRIEQASVIGRVSHGCPSCGGTGTQPGRPCHFCRGKCSTPSPRTLVIAVPPGIADGQVIRLRGEGDAGPPGTPPGDLHCRVFVERHPLFERIGADLAQVLELSFVKAALGGKVDIRTLDGEIELTIPSGTQYGQVFRVAGRGLPRGEGGRGDMLAQVRINVPTDLTDDQRELLSKFEP